MAAPQMAAPQMAANGGIIGSHVPGYTTPPGYNSFDYPSGGVRVRRAEGGIMDLGGMEKDYRAEGGFVPIGGEEKADDVPARLSKNEFVFTADAVRQAGGGDIDSRRRSHAEYDGKFRTRRTDFRRITRRRRRRNDLRRRNGLKDLVVHKKCTINKQC